MKFKEGIGESIQDTTPPVKEGIDVYGDRYKTADHPWLRVDDTEPGGYAIEWLGDDQYSSVLAESENFSYENLLPGNPEAIIPTYWEIPYAKAHALQYQLASVRLRVEIDLEILPHHRTLIKDDSGQWKRGLGESPKLEEDITSTVSSPLVSADEFLDASKDSLFDSSPFLGDNDGPYVNLEEITGFTDNNLEKAWKSYFYTDPKDKNFSPYYEWPGDEESAVEAMIGILFGALTIDDSVPSWFVSMVYSNPYMILLDAYALHPYLSSDCFDLSNETNDGMWYVLDQIRNDERAPYLSLGNPYPKEYWGVGYTYMWPIMLERARDLDYLPTNTVWSASASVEGLNVFAGSIQEYTNGSSGYGYARKSHSIGERMVLGNLPQASLNFGTYQGGTVLRHATETVYPLVEGESPEGILTVEEAKSSVSSTMVGTYIGTYDYSGLFVTETLHLYKDGSAIVTYTGSGAVTIVEQVIYMALVGPPYFDEWLSLEDCIVATSLGGLGKHELYEDKYSVFVETMQSNVAIVPEESERTQLGLSFDSTLPLWSQEPPTIRRDTVYTAQGDLFYMKSATPLNRWRWGYTAVVADPLNSTYNDFACFFKYRLYSQLAEIGGEKKGYKDLSGLCPDNEYNVTVPSIRADTIDKVYEKGFLMKLEFGTFFYGAQVGFQGFTVRIVPTEWLYKTVTTDDPDQDGDTTMIDQMISYYEDDYVIHTFPGNIMGLSSTILVFLPVYLKNVYTFNSVKINADSESMLPEDRRSDVVRKETPTEGLAPPLKFYKKGNTRRSVGGVPTDTEILLVENSSDLIEGEPVAYTSLKRLQGWVDVPLSVPEPENRDD
jgi:hypothetical protein